MKKPYITEYTLKKLPTTKNSTLKDAKSRNWALNSLNKKPVDNLRNVARAKFVAEARAALSVVHRAHNLTAVATLLIGYRWSSQCG